MRGTNSSAYLARNKTLSSPSGRRVPMAQGRLEDAQWEVDEIRILAPDIDFEWVKRAYPIQDFRYKEPFRNVLTQDDVL
jgi:hypothetical protein